MQVAIYLIFLVFCMSSGNLTEEVKSNIDEVIGILQKTKDLLTDVKQECKDGNIAFHAMLEKTVMLTSAEAVIFNHVLTNKGNAYSSSTGHFTAPCNGLYHFSSTFLSGNTGRLHLEMVKNGEMISRGHSSGPGAYSQGAMTAITEMSTGDVVNVRHYDIRGTESILGNWSFFTGNIMTGQ